MQQQAPPQGQPPQQQDQQQGQQQEQPQNAEPEALRNLIVNYIPTTINEPQLRQIFEMYGPSESVKIVTDRETRSSKGFGFIKYRHAASAAHAIQYLNGYNLLNKRLKVGYANQGDAQRSMGGGGAPMGGAPMGGAPGTY